MSNRNGRFLKIAAASVTVGALAAYGTPAIADTGALNVAFATASGCTTCRTLELRNLDGTLITSTSAPLNISSGSGGFLADVKDAGIDPAALGNFDVEATMSNLYEATTNGTTTTFNCGVSIPSSAVSLSSLPSLLNASNVGAVLTPVFNLTGILSGNAVIDPLLTLAGIAIPTGTVSASGLQSATTTALDQAQIAGNSLTTLTGSILSNNTLPFNLPALTSGHFTVPDLPPTGSGCSAPTGSATQVPVLKGLLDGVPPAVGTLTGPLLSTLQGLIPSQTVASLISAGELTGPQAEAAIATALNTTSLALDSVTGLLGDLEAALNGTVSGVVDAATSLTGTYGAGPALAITPPSGTAPASYLGVVTLTLTSGA